MSYPSPALLRHIQNQQNEIDAKKFRVLQQPNLFDEHSFYRAFTQDLLAAKREVIIYCPFVSKFRSEFFKRTLKELQHRNVAVFIFTRPIEEHENIMRSEVTCALRDYEAFGATISYLPGYIHQKAAIIDREILWEGSLNILSQRKSHEMMRRIPDGVSALQVLTHLKLNQRLADGYRQQYERLYRSLVSDTGRSKRTLRILWLSIAIVALGLWLLANLKGMLVPVNSVVGLLRLFF